MNDITLLQVTHNRMDEKVAKRIRDYVIEVTKNQYPIICVSQKPVADFGTNICVGDIGVSKYNLWKQFLIGSREVKTKYIACMDDDTLYSPDHFTSYRPPTGYFAYETNYWFCQEDKDFYWRYGDESKKGGMFGCIVETQTLVDNLTRRYEKYPTPPYASDSTPERVRYRVAWGEPGCADQQFGMRNRRSQFASPNPCVVFLHAKSMGFKQFTRKLFWWRRNNQISPNDMTQNLEQFGDPKSLWNKFWHD